MIVKQLNTIWSSWIEKLKYFTAFSYLFNSCCLLPIFQHNSFWRFAIDTKKLYKIISQTDMTSWNPLELLLNKKQLYDMTYQSSHTIWLIKSSHTKFCGFTCVIFLWQKYFPSLYNFFLYWLDYYWNRNNFFFKSIS